MTWILAALPLPAGVFLYRIFGAATDPTGGWLTALSGLGVAGILCGYLAFDNTRLRKELKDCTATVLKKDEEHAKLLVDTLARYERLLPIETESQRIHTESIKVLERSITMMHQLAGRPALDPGILSKLDGETIRKLIGGTT
jgi:hypothetical protein